MLTTYVGEEPARKLLRRQAIFEVCLAAFEAAGFEALHIALVVRNREPRQGLPEVINVTLEGSDFAARAIAATGAANLAEAARQLTQNPAALEAVFGHTRL